MYARVLIFWLLLVAVCWCARGEEAERAAKNTTKATTTTTLAPPADGPCKCRNGKCSCCVPVGLLHKTCLNVVYDRNDFAFTTSLQVDGTVLFSNQVSGKNPPPMCARFRSSQICLVLSNIYFAGQNMHACVGLKAEIIGTTALDTLLGCMRMGANGMAVVPVEEGGGLTDLGEELPPPDDYDDSA